MSRPKLVLDLDNTLVCSLEIKSGPYSKLDTKRKDELSDTFMNHDMDDQYIVFERPYLQKFLDFVFSKFDVSIWTAASKSYAIFILENIILNSKKKRNVDWFLYEDNCHESLKVFGDAHPKNLGLLDMYSGSEFCKKAVLIDDLRQPEAKGQEFSNIMIFPFEVLDSQALDDDHLLKVMEQLKEMM